MSTAASRSLLVLIAAALIISPLDAWGRGPGGRGGGGGGRAAGGRGGHAKEFSKPKKKSGGPRSGLTGAGPQAGPDLAGIGDKLGGGLQNLQGKGRGKERFSQESLTGRGQQLQQSVQSRDGQFQQHAQNAIKDFQNGPQPFTAQWYADHPNAWQYTHPHADAWAAATATGVAAWLGWAAYGDSTPVYGTSYNTTYVYEQPVIDESNAVVEDTPEEINADKEAEANDAGQWLALGVYTMQSTAGEPTSRFLQLAVNHAGELRGVYYDEVSGSSQNLTGRIDQSTQMAEWSVDSNPQITFHAGLGALTQATGTIEVVQPSGRQTWRIAREQTNG